MAQNAKMIDLKRSYVPIDPRSFPQTLHTSFRDEAPENNIPVVAFDGYNFIPTAYGYKSYFGINQELDANPIPARVDDIFIYQTRALRNIAVALTEEGIFWKDATVEGGSWTHAVVYTLDPFVLPADQPYNRWTKCVLNNDIYVYQQGRASLYRIYTNSGVIAFEELTPNFLNMAGQMGIFRAGNRLGFWDSDESIAWSNLDDFEDFTPSTTTLAGSAKFAAQVGIIVDIQAHGAGFIIYATQSILFIRQRTDQLFQWDTNVIFSENGIAYPRHVAVASPDTTHFVWSQKGFYKIENGKEEIIIPEVRDFFNSSDDLKYLKILQGRYLFVETIGRDLLEGRQVFTEERVPDTIITLPAVNVPLADAIEESLLTGNDFCALIKNNNNFQNQVQAMPNPEDKKEGTFLQPMYKCFLRMPMIPAVEDIAYDMTPCGATFNGEDIPFSPDIGSTDGFSSEYREVLGSDAWLDGNWTIERFVKTQTALWELDNQRLAAWHAAIGNKAETRSYSVNGAVPFTNTELSRLECYGMSVPDSFSDPKFGWNPCSFWLTRYALGTLRLKTTTATTGTASDTLRDLAPAAYSFSPVGSLFSPSIAHLQARLDHSGGKTYGAVIQFPSGPLGAFGGPWSADGISLPANTFYREVGFFNRLTPTYASGVASIKAYWPPSLGYTVDNTVRGYLLYGEHEAAGRYKKTFNFFGYNDLIANSTGPVPDTAYCVLVGYKYTKEDNTEGYIAASECINETSDIDDSPARTTPLNGPTLPVNKETGMLCGLPFEPVTIPGEPAVEVNWPAQEIIVPGSSFVLREGNPAPPFPTMEGAYVYDLHLKKWGKMIQSYQHLLDFSPLNSQAGDTIPINTFDLKSGILRSNGMIYLFDDRPWLSKITYGKIGYDRLYHTSVEEVRVDFARNCSGTITVDTSITGKNLAEGIAKTESFSDQNSITLYGGFPGKWHTISIEGYYDLSYMEFRGIRFGQR